MPSTKSERAKIENPDDGPEASSGLGREAPHRQVRDHVNSVSESLACTTATRELTVQNRQLFPESSFDRRCLSRRSDRTVTAKIRPNTAIIDAMAKTQPIRNFGHLPLTRA
jgi:hypothetical protein